MYICHECQTQFQKPLKIIEKHGLSSPPYENIFVCPRCKSENYEKAGPRFCRNCGAKLKSSQTNYCSTACKINGKKLFKKERILQNKLKLSPIYSIVRQLDNHNKTHGTHLSYGQYCALINNKKEKDGKKNG